MAGEPAARPEFPHVQKGDEMSLGSVPWWNWALQAVGALCAYIGAEANTRLQVRGFYFWLAANLALLTVHALAGLWLLCALDVAFSRLNLRGVARWQKARVNTLRRQTAGSTVPAASGSNFGVSNDDLSS